MIADLVAFLNARLNEDEEAARDARACAEVKDGRWFDGEDEINDDNGFRLATVNHPFVTTHIARHDPERVLREVAAKRRIVAAELDRSRDCNSQGPSIALLDLAIVYSDHPDFMRAAGGYGG